MNGIKRINGIGYSNVYGETICADENAYKIFCLSSFNHKDFRAV